MGEEGRREEEKIASDFFRIKRRLLAGSQGNGCRDSADGSCPHRRGILRFKGTIGSKFPQHPFPFIKLDPAFTHWTTPALCFLGTFCLWSVVQAKPLDVIGDDDASNTEYTNNGWVSDKGDGSGFKKWSLQTKTGEGGNSHAGFYIASADAKPDLNGIAMRGKAFGMFANGTAFEAASAAFRPFDKPLKVGQSFSFLMEHGQMVKKFDTDVAGGGSCGLTLRTSNDATGVDDYNKDVRFEIGYYKNDSGDAYNVYDGDGMKKLDVPFTDAGLAITFTLITEDTYDLEVTTLSNRQTVKLAGRKLNGTAGAPITSFCIFDRNGETDDVYFNGFQILQPPQ